MSNLFRIKLKILVLAILISFTNLFTSTAQTITSNQTGTNNGYWYTFWKDSPGSVTMTLGSGGNFSVSWSNVGNFVCGKGWSTGSESRTITYSRSGSAQYIGVYGWMTNPLVEYYIGNHSGGSRVGTYSADGTTYTLYRDNRNGPNIQGNGPFMQYNAVGGGTSVNFGQHVNGWRNLGAQVGSQNYQVVAIEGWNSSGNASATVGSGGSSSSSSSSGGSSSGGSRTVTVRARGTSGSESITLRVNNQNVATWTLTTSMTNRSASTSLTGGITVAFTNDASGRDVQIDYIQVNGVTRQSESQTYNTGVWQNNQCGGSNSEWLHCNGAIGYGNISKEAADLEDIAELPTEYALAQNYPNPFNPATNIDYSLAEAGFVKLAVYDLIGREVQTLVNEVKAPGTYTALFNAENIPSGVYFYTLQTNGQSFTKKMILMK